jgi:hypothetical protein
VSRRFRTAGRLAGGTCVKTGDLRFDFGRLEGLGCCDGAVLRISARNAAGERYPLCDGGFTDWTARLLSDDRERFLGSGIGADLVCARFR